MACREIVTLQFGSYANFVGAHWWNMQCDAYSNELVSEANELVKATKEINFDCIFREGKTFNNEVTYTPRAIFYCTKDSLHTLKQTGTLYDLKNTNEYVNTWNTSPEVIQQEAFEKNSYLKGLDEDETGSGEKAACTEVEEDKESGLEASVQVWSDYLKQHLHPKTIEIIPCDAGPFEHFCIGAQTYENRRDEMEEKIRFFTEECDNLQGFHILFDPSDAFSGLACSFYEDYVLDEFHNKAHVLALLHPHEPYTNKHSNLRSLANLMLTHTHFSQASSIIPLSTLSSLHRIAQPSSHRTFDRFTYNNSLPYHTSAILATAFNNLSLPYRIFNCDHDMKSFYSSLIYDSKNILATQMSYPLVFDTSLGQPLKQPTPPHFTTLTPSLSDQINISIQHISLSGLSKQQLFGANVQHLSESDQLNDFVHKHFNSSPFKTSTTFHHTPLITSDPFPRFMHSPHPRHLSTTAVGTCLQNTPDVSEYLNDVIKGLNHMTGDQVRRYLGEVMDKDDFNDRLEQFRDKRDNYAAA